MPFNSKKIEKFGRNLGFGIKPGVKRFGVSGQFHLAKALVYPHSDDRYKGLNIPRSPMMEQAAFEFLQYNTRLFKQSPSGGHKYYKGDILKFTLIETPHFELINKSYADPLRYKAVYGNQKFIDSNARQIIQRFKESIRYTSSRIEKRELKQQLREFEKKVTRYKWEVEAEKYNVIPIKGQSTEEFIKGASSFLRSRDIALIKKQDAMLALDKDRIGEKQFNGADPGTEIGKGNDLEHIKSDLIRLVQYLKRARWIKLSVGKGIMKPKNTYLRAFLKQHLGGKYREMFLSYNAMNKYATDAYFAPGSEYGHMAKTHNNRKGIWSPLQRRRGFDKSGKEILKNIKDS